MVDWKTGEPPDGPHAVRQAAVQLGVYRAAWAGLRGCPEVLVRTAFYYVRTGETVVPQTVPGPGELATLLARCGAAGRRTGNRAAGSYCRPGGRGYIVTCAGLSR